MNRLSENIWKPVMARTFAILSSSALAAPAAEEVAWTGVPLDIAKTYTPSPERIALRANRRPLFQIHFQSNASPDCFTQHN
ncbi:hypothetical protein [Pseudomonas umsongensis]|uniref:hypothetical protein n=1 Tax=Pseudomonas umsongensis TaxID=198618 RepID=UPI0015C08035|nr:hypothetical protein [Pseudomonas umsongensis]